MLFASPPSPLTASSPLSPKRPRADAESNQADHHENHSLQADNWYDEGFQEPEPKKQRQSNRQVPNVVARNAALQELNGQRASKSSREATDVQTTTTVKKSKSKTTKPSQKKSPRRLRVNELVTASERFDGSDEEDDVGET
jgi:hypothetical protein